jgi:chemotaxis protein CheX
VTTETAGQSEPDVQALEAMVLEIWAALVGLPAEVTERRDPVGPAALTGSVALSGQWTGRVLLDCDDQLSSTIAGAMFDVDPAAASEEQRRDALGELANVLGGNFKALLGPLHSELALPQVRRDEPQAPARGERLLASLGLRCAGQVLRVRFLQRAGEL